jgi:predicted nucleic acid-binding protein
MNTVLVDTSVWINIFKGIETKASLMLKNNSNNFIIATCPVILQEVLQGIVEDQRYIKLSRYFNGLEQLTGNPYQFANEAAQLYRTLRKNGVTVRKPNDCLIAVYALNHKVTLLYDDKDFDFIAKHTQLNKP